MRRLGLLLVVAMMAVTSVVGEVNADLLRAAKKGDAEAVKDLLRQHGTEIADANSGVAAIKAAAEQGHLETIQALLASPAVDSQKAVSAAVLVAAMRGYIETVRILVREAHDPQLRDKAFAGAIAGERVDLARMLLVEGADPGLTPIEGPSPPSATILAMKAGDDSCQHGGLHLQPKELEGDPWLVRASGKYMPMPYFAEEVARRGLTLPYREYVRLIEAETRTARLKVASLAAAFGGLFIASLQVYWRLAVLLAEHA